MDYLISALAFIFLLLVVVVIHELGHYWAARIFKVRVLAFSFGFGKTLLSWKDKLGTSWNIRLLPLGGSVEMYGFIPDKFLKFIDDKSKSETPTEDLGDEGKFEFIPAWQKIIVCAAGCLMNFLFCYLMMLGYFLWKTHSFSESHAAIFDIAKTGFSFAGQSFKDTFSSKALESSGTVIGVAPILHAAVKAGLFVYLKLMVIISFSLACFNLFPIPILDGGLILQYTIESIIRRPLGTIALLVYKILGVLIILTLMLAGFYNDIKHLITGH